MVEAKPLKEEDFLPAGKKVKENDEDTFSKGIDSMKQFHKKKQKTKVVTTV